MERCLDEEQGGECQISLVVSLVAYRLMALPMRTSAALRPFFLSTLPYVASIFIVNALGHFTTSGKVPGHLYWAIIKAINSLQHKLEKPRS